MPIDPCTSITWKVNVMSDDRKPNIGPQELAAVKGSPFLLSQQEWYAIQRYVESALLLPDDEKKMRKDLATGPAEKIPYIGPFDEFKDLLAGYQHIIPHVRNWKDNIFPETVQLAQDISNYATTARTYYGALIPPIETLFLDPGNEAAKNRIASLCTKLAKEAQDNEDRAIAVYKDISEFAQQTSDDEILLKNLFQQYEAKYGKHGGLLADNKKEMESLAAKIEDENKQYEHACIVAETTPTYAWIIFWVALIVASIYGDKAAKLKHEIDVKKDRIKALKDEEQRAMALMGTLNVALKGLGDIQDKIAAALPSIQKIKGVWNAIGSDLNKVGKIIKQDILEEQDLKDLGVENAIAMWQECKLKSDAYQAHAFIDPPKQEAQTA
jgi:hypothetical protein